MLATFLVSSYALSSSCVFVLKGGRWYRQVELGLFLDVILFAPFSKLKI